MKKSTFYILTALIAFFYSHVFAAVRITAESSVVGNVRKAMHYYEEWNGRPATNWTQVNEVIGVEGLEKTFKVSSHYTFVTNQIPMLDDEMGNVILIRTHPVTERTNAPEGRYLITRRSEGLHHTWLAETNVQRMLAAAGVKELPPPEPWPPVTNGVETSANQTTQTPEPRPSERRFIKTPRGSGSERATDASFASPQVAETAVANPWISLLMVALVGAVLAFFLLGKKRKE